MLRLRILIALFLLIMLNAGCTSSPYDNPSFAVGIDESRADLKRMADSPPASPPQRPVLIVGGYADPGVGPARLRSSLARLLGPEAQVAYVDVGFTFTMDSARDRVLAATQAAWPSDNPASTVEVDVIAISMGGLVSRYAALPRADARSLRIARLFTVCTPHRGARLAAVPTLERRVYDMRTGSAFLAGLDEHMRDYEIIPYARLGDAIVGSANTAPTGMTPWWVKPPAMQAAHLFASSDPRILADIARRLRGETPFTQSPPSPLPTQR